MSTPEYAALFDYKKKLMKNWWFPWHTCTTVSKLPVQYLQSTKL